MMMLHLSNTAQFHFPPNFLEKLFDNRLSAFIEKYNIPTDAQYGL